MWENTARPGNKIIKKTYTNRFGEEITVSQPVGEREQQCRTHNRPVSEGYGHTVHKSVEESCYVGKSGKIQCVKTKTGENPSA